jgi:hypothetical protein
MISLKVPSMELLIFVPVQAPADAPPPPIVEVADYLKLTPMQMIVDSFRASTDDFRWTMSRSALHRLQVLLNVGFLFPQYPHARGMKVESSLDGPLQGLLITYERTKARYEWCTKTGTDGGLIVFMGTRDLDLDQMRDICASVTCNEAKLGPPRTPADVAALVDTIEMTKDKAP